MTTAPNDEATAERLHQLCRDVFERPFYAEHFRDVRSLAQPSDSGPFSIRDLPFLSKSDLVASDAAGRGLFDLPAADYVRWHQTSGTTGRPLIVRDTAEDWRWWLRCWRRVLDAAAVTSSDVALMAFSFGPFIGFWTANDSLVDRGATVIPGGGLSTRARLELLVQQRATVLCATPTYALHMASVAAQEGIDLAASDLKQIIVAGEPGGSIRAIRDRLSEAYGAEITDHAGGSEIGAWGYGDREGRGLHVNQSEFIAEVIDFSNPSAPRPIEPGEAGELVLTGLGRVGGPAIRYRTGDIVRPAPAPDGNAHLWLEGGVLGRGDDMVVIRGVNVFPSSIEAVIREILPVEEFRVTVGRAGEMDQLTVEAECGGDRAKRLSELLSDRLAIRIPVQSVPSSTLPRFEAKSRRWIDRRGN